MTILRSAKHRSSRERGEAPASYVGRVAADPLITAASPGSETPVAQAGAPKKHSFSMSKAGGPLQAISEIAAACLRVAIQIDITHDFILFQAVELGTGNNPIVKIVANAGIGCDRRALDLDLDIADAERLIVVNAKRIDSGAVANNAQADTV